MEPFTHQNIKFPGFNVKSCLPCYLTEPVNTTVQSNLSKNSKVKSFYIEDIIKLPENFEGYNDKKSFELESLEEIKKSVFNEKPEQFEVFKQESNKSHADFRYLHSHFLSIPLVSRFMKPFPFNENLNKNISINKPIDQKNIGCLQNQTLSLNKLTKNIPKLNNHHSSFKQSLDLKKMYSHNKGIFIKQPLSETSPRNKFPSILPTQNNFFSSLPQNNYKYNLNHFQLFSDHVYLTSCEESKNISRKRKVRTVFSDQQLNGLEVRY